MRISDWSSDVCSSDLCRLSDSSLPAPCRRIGPAPSTKEETHDTKDHGNCRSFLFRLLRLDQRTGGRARTARQGAVPDGGRAGTGDRRLNRLRTGKGGRGEQVTSNTQQRTKIQTLRNLDYRNCRIDRKRGGTGKSG